MTDGIRTTVVGSYPVPDWLRVVPNRGNLRDATLVVLKTQELAGLDVLSDGELSRFDVNHPETNGMIDYFIRPMSGVDERLSYDELTQFRQSKGMSFRTSPAGTVRKEIGQGTLNLVEDYEAVAMLSAKPIKFTVTSPYMLAKTLHNTYYNDLHELTFAIAGLLQKQVAGIDAPVVQVDEANLPGAPQDAGIAAEAINTVLSRTNAEKAVHLCFGNYGGQTIQQGLLASLLPFFNALECDHLVLECARRPTEELNCLRDLKPGIDVGLGVVDIKDNEVETPDVIAQRIELAVERIGENRVRWIHPDCGFWMLQRTVADRKMAALVAGRDLFEGRA